MEIVINVADLNDLTKNLFSEWLERLVCELGKNLDLDALMTIIITEDFGEDLASFEKAHGLKQWGFTNDNSARAIGKTKWYKKNGQWYQAILLDKVVIAYGLSEDWLVAVNVIHHELCHVHDGYNKKLLLGHKDTESDPEDSLGYLLNNQANQVWSEYVACRLSVATIYPGCFELYFSHLDELVKYVSDKSLKDILSYRSHHNINRLFDVIRVDSSRVLKMAATICGYIHGVNSVELYNEVTNHLSEIGFEETWLGLSGELKILFDSYPKWRNETVLEPLSNIILMYWNTLGIYPKNTEVGLYVGVP